MPSFTTVNYRLHNQVATIELNRKESLNSFNQQLRLDLLAAVNHAETDENVRIVVIAGAGKGFSSGADLKEGMAGYDTIEEQILVEYKPFLLKIRESDKIYISSVSGAAAGIGGALAMTCDLMVMSESAYIYQAFAAIALIPDGGASWYLVNSLGYKRAFELIVEAGKLTAQDCVQFGIANKVVNDAELADYTQTWAERLAKGAPLAQKYIKDILNKAQRQELSSTIELEAKHQNSTITSEDYQEGVNAFFTKRKPSFTGK